MAQVDLDDQASLASVDRSGMLGLIGGTGSQLLEGLRAGLSAARLPRGDGLRALVVCGMGGSGVAGDVMRSAFGAQLEIPILVSKGYALPSFCNHATLVVAVSHSGNTEETLAAYGEAVRRGCRVVAVSVGGALAERSADDGVPHVGVPEGVPVPRAALGHLTGAIAGVLEGVGVVAGAGRAVEATASLLAEMAHRLGPDRAVDENDGKRLASWLLGRTPVVWGSEGVAEAPGVRWKTQFNENAKVPAFHAALPELDHNEIEGWSPGSGIGHAVIVLRHPGEDLRIARRVEATIEAVAGSGLEFRQAEAEGRSPLEWTFSLIMLGDFVSAYLALLRGVDPTPIPVLTGLKRRLAR